MSTENSLDPTLRYDWLKSKLVRAAVPRSGRPRLPHGRYDRGNGQRSRNRTPRSTPASARRECESHVFHRVGGNDQAVIALQVRRLEFSLEGNVDHELADVVPLGAARDFRQPDSRLSVGIVAEYRGHVAAAPLCACDRRPGGTALLPGCPGQSLRAPAIRVARINLRVHLDDSILTPIAG